MGDAGLLVRPNSLVVRCAMQVNLHSVESDLIVTMLLAFVSISHTRYDAR